MNIAKFYEYFDPKKVKGRVHIIGVGAIGSTLAVLLARMGISQIDVYDFDMIESHNVANQQFGMVHYGMTKEDAIEEIVQRIDPAIKVNKNGKWDGHNLDGYVFLAVDNIDLRREIVEKHMYNMNVKSIMDFRMSLTDAQHYAADWSDMKDRQKLLKTMQFTHEEAEANVKVNACGMSMSIMPTVSTVCSVGMANFVNFINGKELKSVVLVDPFRFDILPM